MYKNTLTNIDKKLVELKALLHKKAEIEYKNNDQVDFNEKELAYKVKSVNFKAQTIMNKYFSFNLLGQIGGDNRAN